MFCSRTVTQVFKQSVHNLVWFPCQLGICAFFSQLICLCKDGERIIASGICCSWTDIWCPETVFSQASFTPHNAFCFCEDGDRSIDSEECFVAGQTCKCSSSLFHNIAWYLYEFGICAFFSQWIFSMKMVAEALPLALLWGSILWMCWEWIWGWGAACSMCGSGSSDSSNHLPSSCEPYFVGLLCISGGSFCLTAAPCHAEQQGVCTLLSLCHLWWGC